MYKELLYSNYLVDENIVSDDDIWKRVATLWNKEE